MAFPRTQGEPMMVTFLAVFLTCLNIALCVVIWRMHKRIDARLREWSRQRDEVRQ